jgi:hypothetical protein
MPQELAIADIQAAFLEYRANFKERITPVGPVKQFLMEAEDPATALHFIRGPKGRAQKELQLAPA